MFPLFPETRKTFQKCNPPHFKFYLSNLTNKKFPHMVLCQVFFTFFVLFIEVKTYSKIALHHMGIYFYDLTSRDKI